MNSVISSETVISRDDLHGCGKFPEAPGARRDAGDEPTWMYLRRVSEEMTEFILAPTK